MRSDQCLLRGTGQNFYVKNFEEGTIGKKHILVYDFYLLCEDVCLLVINSRHRFYFWSILMQE
jgi:hypothetical protein